MPTVMPRGAIARVLMSRIVAVSFISQQCQQSNTLTDSCLVILAPPVLNLRETTEEFSKVFGLQSNVVPRCALALNWKSGTNICYPCSLRMVHPYSAAIGGYILLGYASKFNRFLPLLGQEACPDLTLHAPPLPFWRDLCLHGVDDPDAADMDA